MASLPLASSMAHLDICLLYYVNKSCLACYDPLGSCFCCVAEMCGAQLGCLASRVNPSRQISCFSQPDGVGTVWGVPGRDQKINPNTVLPGWPLRCNKGAIFHPWGLFRASHRMNKPGIFKLADLLALQVIALVYQCSTQFITYSGTSRILVLMSSVRRQGSEVFVFESVCMFMCVAANKEKINTMTPRSEITVLLPVVGFIYTVVMIAKVLCVHICTKL